MDSIKNIKEIRKEQEEQNNNLNFLAPPIVVEPSTEATSIFSRFNSYFKIITPAQTSSGKSPEPEGSNDILSMKATFQQQSKLLNNLLLQMELIKTEVPDTGELNAKVEELELLLEEKEEELQNLKKQTDITKKMMIRFEDVQKEFVLMQSKMAVLEKQVITANNLIIELENTKDELSQLKKEWTRKNEKLQHVLGENQGMHQQLCETEDKLQEANLQRQQLFKKVKVLEEMNADFQAISDAHQKMKTELRRIGELESMLNMMTIERDELLQRQMQEQTK